MYFRAAKSKVSLLSPCLFGLITKSHDTGGGVHSSTSSMMIPFSTYFDNVVRFFQTKANFLTSTHSIRGSGRMNAGGITSCRFADYGDISSSDLHSTSVLAFSALAAHQWQMFWLINLPFPSVSIASITTIPVPKTTKIYYSHSSTATMSGASACNTLFRIWQRSLWPWMGTFRCWNTWPSRLQLYTIRL